MFPYYLKTKSELSLKERIQYYIDLAIAELTQRGINNVSKSMIARRYALSNNDYAAANQLYASP